MKKLLLLTALAAMMATGAQAQRFTDRLDRGVVAVPMNDGESYLVTWRKFGTEYYDTRYNLYRNGTKIASEVDATCWTVAGGKATDTYQVEAVVRGVAQPRSAEVKAWAQQYLEVPMQPVVNRAGKEIGNAVTNGASNTVSGYTLNDVSLADVDGDGTVEFILKRNNSTGNLNTSGNTTDFNLYECYKMDGTRLWWIDLGPNLMAGADEQWDMIGYDWDRDGRAEMLMRGADNMIIHTATGKTINIGNMSYFAPRDEYTHKGAEYLLYLNGATGEPYGWDGTSDSFTPMAYPLPRFEEGEAKDVLNSTSAEYAAVWGEQDTGHRSSKHYFGAPYLDGRNPSIFLGRGCYTRHKACALDVNPTTHELTLRWRWNCYDSRSPWFGNGFHNFAIADVDMDGRDEIVYGSMILDDTGYGLATTGLGHGDAQHCGDLDPYRWGLEQFTCQEGSEGNSYWNATTGQLYYRKADGGDDGRALAGNFTNLYPGGEGRSVSSGILNLSSDKIVQPSGDDYMAWGDLNNRIFWDGDLLDEIMNSPGVQRSVKITKWGNGRLSFYGSDGLYTPTGILNNSSKNNPSAQGDILGDWREELVLRTSDNSALHVYTTNYATEHALYTLWHDHQYRNGMAWQSVGYNQPPHQSYFLGELEGITIAPPPLMLEGRTELKNGQTIGTTADHLLVSGYEDQTLTVSDGASPYILTVNAPAWVKGSGDQQATASTPKSPARTILKYTVTLTGGAFSGATRIVKQGEGTLVMPAATHTHTGRTEVWNGTLRLDGTLQSSQLWLNRHTTLVSDGGRFLGGLQADYNATLQPGGEGHVGTISATTLALGFGSRIVFDAEGTTFDHIVADKLTIEVKDWEVGPKYKAPVFQIAANGELAAGRYELGTVGTVEGNLGDVVIEGISGKRAELTAADGKLWLSVEELRAPASVVWNGTAENSVWDLAVTKNFLNNGTPDYASIGDDIIFDDQAQSTNVVIRGAVSPKSVTFNNDTKNYQLSGDSILGDAPLVKNGKGTLTITNDNHVGPTTINGGRVVVNMLANTTGQDYGSLGSYRQPITIGDGGTLAVNGILVTDQPINVAGKATIDVPAGSSLRTNKGYVGASATVVKTGDGTLTMGTPANFGRLRIERGTVNAAQLNNTDQLPQTVELAGGTLWGTTMDDLPGRTTTANFVVPEGKTGTYYGPYRGTNTGSLTGAGTFNVYSGGVRCYWDGDWSQFEGTIVPGTYQRQTKPSYEPTFDFRNSKGIPKATLRLNQGVTFNSTVNLEMASVYGAGTLGGSVTYTIGGNGADIYSTFHTASTTTLRKKGKGYLYLAGAGNVAGKVIVGEGQLIFGSSNLSNPFIGGALTVEGSGEVLGAGLVAAVTMESGSQLTPCWIDMDDLDTVPATLKTSAAMNVKQGAKLKFQILSATRYSQLQPMFLTLNGTVKVELSPWYTPKLGDEFLLWSVTRTFSGTPTWQLPKLPEGLYWDISDLKASKGKLRITDDPSLGIGQIAADAEVSCELFTTGGVRVAEFTTVRSAVRSEVTKLRVQPGVYVVKMMSGRNFESETVVVRQR